MFLIRTKEAGVAKKSQQKRDREEAGAGESSRDAAAEETKSTVACFGNAKKWCWCRSEYQRPFVWKDNSNLKV